MILKNFPNIFSIFVLYSMYNYKHLHPVLFSALYTPKNLLFKYFGLITPLNGFERWTNDYFNH